METSLFRKAIMGVQMAGSVVANRVDKFLFKFIFESEEFPEFDSSDYHEKVALLFYGVDSTMLSQSKTVNLNNLAPRKPIEYSPKGVETPGLFELV